MRPFNGRMRHLSVPISPQGTLAEFLSSGPQALSRTDVLAHWSRHHLDRALSDGHVARVLPGVYVATQHLRHPVAVGRALNLWAPRALVTGAHALHLYSGRLPQPKKMDLVSANGDPLHPPAWVRVHQTGVPRLSSFASDVACALPARALLDAWRYAPRLDRRNILWEALWVRVCTWRQLAQEVNRAARIAGRRDLERVLSWFESGATSPLEVKAKHETFTGPRFREFEWQAELSLPNRRVKPDMLHRATKVAVELDGDSYHSTRTARDADRQRRTELAAAGYTVIGFGWRDVFDRPQWCREQLLAAVRSRASSH